MEVSGEAKRFGFIENMFKDWSFMPAGPIGPSIGGKFGAEMEPVLGKPKPKGWP